MGSSLHLCGSLTVLFLSICHVGAQLTPEQVQIKAQALFQARQLVSGKTEPLAEREDPVILYTAARLEAHLNKRAAVLRWDGVPPPEDVAAESSTQPNAIPDDSSLVSFGTPRRSLLALFRPYMCRLRYDKNFIGGNIPENHNTEITTWQDCCEACFQRSDCFAWTLNNGTVEKNRGCWLKGEGYTTSIKPGYISGTLTTAERGDEPDSGFPSPPPEEPVPGDSSPPPPSPPPSQQEPELSSPPPPVHPKPDPEPEQPPVDVPKSKAKYAEVLGLSWKFFEAQRSGKTPAWNRIKYRGDSHLKDAVVGGWYDAGDYLKLNFPLAPSVGIVAWGILEFEEGYKASGELQNALNNLRFPAEYLMNCMDWKSGKYIGQIGDPDTDHSFWGRPEEQGGQRQVFLYDKSMAAADLYGAVAGALATSAMVFRKHGDPEVAAEMIKVAEELYAWGAAKDGKYSNYYKSATHSIYPSTDSQDSMAWAAGWLYRCTKDTAYLSKALKHFTSGTVDIYPGWDSVWVNHAIHMVALDDSGVEVPGIATYRNFVDKEFLRAWLQADGYKDVISTPGGMHYPAWNEWANLAFSTSASAMALIHAKYTKDSGARAKDIAFAKQQLDYAMGSGIRSYVCGYGKNPPTQPHHASSSCPDKPATCDWPQFDSKKPNPQILYGALVAGPGGVRMNKKNPDDTYNDKRNDYVTNEVANDYNAGFTTALAGIVELL